jgi:medium-chain acyl-[acyl-carrier-protein] hydrolase
MDGGMAGTEREAAAGEANGLLDRIATLPRDKQVELLRRLRQPPTAERWIIRHRDEPGAAVRLFCFSHAGGGAAVFRSWPADVPPAVEVWGVQLPGRESRIGEPPYRRMVPLTAALVAALGPHLDKPFAFFGHSMGALVAFELARELRRASLPQPARLFLAAFRAPQMPSPNVKIHHWPDEVLKVVLQRDGTPGEVLRNDELMRALLPTLRADFEVCDTYQYTPEEPLDCPFSVFGGLDDVRVRASDLPGWRIHSRSGCSVSMLPGTHFFLHSARQRLLAEIQSDLENDGTL